ncbi:DUF4393 domain-containing protein [Dyella kyungheensis]|uniref:DUF4393 domain-containing protein n=1 Tax=Dyella kyungheensis TaxID=1242174 RepID=A0ABS2JV42_9GAMM|nr:DUF4393 domain-containing protein [Dyella kyungheensis]MBM7121928.1 DUF4393 domain-containing protein [Dyella kyungheensis]
MSSEKDVVDDVIKASDAIAGLIKVAGKSPEAKVSANNIGRAAVTITAAINNALLPLAAVNFAFDKAKRYFEERFPGDFVEKTESIPKERLVEPDPSIAGPALQGLAFNHASEDLRKMYLNLLSASIDCDRANGAHPAFADVLRQTTPFEAQIVSQILEEAYTPIARVVLAGEELDDSGRPIHVIPVKNHLLDIVDSETGECSPDPRIELMVDNYCRLGLITVSYENKISDDKQYEWAYSHPVYAELHERGQGQGRLVSNDGKHVFRVGLQFGLLRMTVFGNLFSVAVGIRENPVHTNEL